MALVLLSLRWVKGLLVSWPLPTAAGTQQDPCLHVTHVARRSLPFISAMDGGAGPAEHPCCWNRTGPGLGDGEHMAGEAVMSRRAGRVFRADAGLLSSLSEKTRGKALGVSVAPSWAELGSLQLSFLGTHSVS